VNRLEPNVHVRLLRRIAAEVHEAPGGASSSLRAFADLVYTTYYLGETSAATQARFRDVATAIVLREDPAFGAALREANRGAGFMDEGWRVVGSREGGLVVRKDRISLVARPGDVAGHSDDGTVSVRFPNERPYAYPDYYVAIGNGGPPPQGSAATPMVRLYFNVSPTGATRLLSAVTSTMGAALRRFAIKILNHPQSYGRPDAAVALVRRDEIGHALSLLPGVLRDTGPHRAPAVPAFTLRLCRGVGLAEDPAEEGTRLSFGQHRAFVVAKGLARAVEEGAGDAEARMAFVVRELAAADIDPARPYCRRATLDGFHAEVDRHIGALEEGSHDHREHDVATQAGGSAGTSDADPPRLRPSGERLGARGA
jgi:HopA1 effector protein family